MGCIGVNATANTTPNTKMNAMLAELLGTLPDFSYSAAVAATTASAIDMPMQELINIFRRPTISWRRAKFLVSANNFKKMDKEAKSTSNRGCNPASDGVDGVKKQRQVRRCNTNILHHNGQVVARNVIP